MQRAPLVSVIVPSYNKPEYLPECLRSIQAQTFHNWECIVVSDGSPRVGEIRAAVAAMGDNRFRVVEHEVNRGLAAARNTGIREARGAMLGFVDEDDLLAEEYLQKMHTPLQEGGADATICGARCFGGRSGQIYPELRPPVQLLVDFSIVGSAMVVRYGVLSIIGVFDETQALRYGREDLEWWVRALSMGMRIAVVREPLYFYRHGNGRRGEAQALHERLKLHDFAIKRYLCAKFKKPLGLSDRFCRKYIAGGYRIAARAHAKRGETGKAIWKALGAMWTDPGIANVRFVLRMLAEGVAGEEQVESWMAHLRRQ